MQPPRLLRVGLIRDGQLVAERHLAPPLPLTLGGDGSTTLPADLDTPHTLIAWRDGIAHLSLLPGMTGRLSLGGRAQSAKAIQGTVPIEDGDRGKLTLGDSTILFRFAPAPPLPVVRAEDLDFRAPLLEREDRRLVASLALFATLGSMWASFAYNAPPMSLDAELDFPTYEQVTVYVPPPPAEETPPPEETPEPATTPTQGTTGPARAVAKTTPQRAPAAAPVRRPSRLEARFLTTKGETLIAPVDASRSFTESLDAKLRAVAQQQVDLDTRRHRTSSGPQTDRDIGELTASANTHDVALVDAPRVKITSTIEVRDPVFTGDVRGLDRVLRARRGQFKRCYDSALNRDPSVRGRVVLAWTIEDGRVYDARVEEHNTGSPEFTACLVRLLKRWKFDGVEDGEVSQPFIFMSDQGNGTRFHADDGLAMR